MEYEALKEQINPNNVNMKAFVIYQKVKGALNYLPDFGKTCKAILDTVVDEMEAENCSLMLIDPETGELIVRAARGKEEKESVYYSNGISIGKKFKPGEGIAGYVLKEGKGVILNDVLNETRFVKINGLGKKVRSLICYPVKEKDQVVGVFNISHSRKGAFDKTSEMILSYISNQMGAALTSTRFFLELNEMNRLMKKESSYRDLKEKHSNSSYSTFVEIGEITRENGIFIYAHEKMHKIKEIIDQIANTDVTVLIQGESGVGKEVVARSIHQNSFRRDKPFVKVNCAALPSELLESELFGYEKGAFTGAYRQKLGKFELANGGTIFLDEISEISLSLQGKLLQVLQDREFSRLGGKTDIRVDVRVLAATNKNIEDAVKQGRFREDLFYRLNVVNLTIPPLRERKEEIPLFVEYFMNKFSKKYNKKPVSLSGYIMNIFNQYHWPGNVRELENVIQRLVVLGKEKAVLDELIPSIKEEPILGSKKVVLNRRHWPSLKEIHREALIKAESELIIKALEMTNWNRKKAAELLNISYKALLYKIKDCGLDKKFLFNKKEI